MKWKVLIIAFFFSLSFNIAALVAFLFSHRPACCPMERKVAQAQEQRLMLSEKQRQEFERLDDGYIQERRAAALRLQKLRQKMLRRILDDNDDQAEVENILGQITAQQLMLQRRLLDNLRAKLALLDAGQRDQYSQIVENLALGCGCVGCSGTCH